MPKQSAKAEINNFVGGLNTEASPLNFPTNATIDEENFELNKNGVRERRLGLDFEEGHSLIDLGISFADYQDTATNTFNWNNAGGVFDNEFIVVQVGNVLHFFDSQEDSISSDGYLGSLTVDNFSNNVKYSFASVDGVLTAVSGAEDVYIVEYDDTSSTFSGRYDRIKVRDLWGVEVVDEREYEEDSKHRGSVTHHQHIYNLRNQSWGNLRRLQGVSPLRDPIASYRENIGLFPSNSEVVWAGLTFRADASPGPTEIFQWNLMRDTFGADLSASKGYFVIDLLRRGTSRLQAYETLYSSYDISPGAAYYNVTTLPLDRTEGGPKVISEFAGRVWYGGFGSKVIGGDRRSPALSPCLFFSQLVQSPDDIFKCYQDGDPSSRDSSDLVATDGGFIRISGAATITGMVSLGRELVVLATNGVWAIKGTDNGGFSATSYEAVKLSSYGCLSPYSLVVDGESLYYWSEDGIYTAQRNQFGDLVVQSLSQNTIQTLYEEIPSEQKRNVIGILDSFDRKIRWLYNTDSEIGNNNYAKEIILDTNIGAFYKNRVFNIEGTSPEVIGIVNGSSFRKGFSVDNVFANDVQVVANLEDVQVERETRRSGVQSVRYLTIVPGTTTVSLTFSSYKNFLFKDWQTFDGVGVDAKAFMLTGSTTGGDTTIHKQIPYLIMHMYRTEQGLDSENQPINPSSCLVRSQWDWATSAKSNKWSPLFQAYRYRRPLFIDVGDTDYDNGFETVVTKNKIRGRGRAFSFYMETEPEKDCRIIGWALDINGNSKT